MASGIVTSNFEERYDRHATFNHNNVMINKIKESLMLTGKNYNGIELDGMLYSRPEMMMIGTHKGPMLSKFTDGNPEIEVRYEIKKNSGDGKNSLAGKRGCRLSWFDGGCKIFIDPRSGRGDQSVVGWSNMGIDFSKSGSIMNTLNEWLPQMRLDEIDQITMSGLLDALSGRDDYTMMFVKAVLTLRGISVGYTVEGTEWDGVEELPKCIYGDKRAKIGQIGKHSCAIDLDYFDDREAQVMMLSSMEYPSLYCELDGVDCIYSKLSLPECDTVFLASSRRRIAMSVSTPERWWKSMVSCAKKLGAIEDLIRAFRITRGLASWSYNIKLLGFDEFFMTMGIHPTRGCKSVLMDSVLSRTDKVSEPTNLVCSLGELICDWAAGVEMTNMLFHVSDEFGLANLDINRNVTGLPDASVGDSILREAGFLDFGPQNVFYQEVAKRLGTKVAFLGCPVIKSLVMRVAEMMKRAILPEEKELRKSLQSIKNLCFTNYYGPLWKENATNAAWLEGRINSSTWGATARNKKNVFYLRMWMDLHGLSDRGMLFCGYNAAQKMGIESISHVSIGKIQGAHGIYEEKYREVNWLTHYDTRVGSETYEKDRLEFVKTYLGMEDEGESEDIMEETAVPISQKETIPSFRGTLRRVAQVAEPVKEVTYEPTPVPQKEKEKPMSPDATEKVPGSGDLEEALKMRPNKMQLIQSRIAESFGHKGINSFLRLVEADGDNYKVKTIIGDGLCVARAIAQGIRETGQNIDDNIITQFLQKELDQPNWFQVEPSAVIINKLGYGVALYDVRNNLVYGVGTDGRQPNEIIGITYDGVHCNCLTRSTGDKKVPVAERVYEKSMSEVAEVMSAMFDSTVKMSET